MFRQYFGFGFFEVGDLIKAYKNHINSKIQIHDIHLQENITTYREYITKQAHKHRQKLTCTEQSTEAQLLAKTKTTI